MKPGGSNPLQAYGLGFLFGGRPRLRVPAGVSQLVSLQRAQHFGRPAIRLIHSWPQRRHLHSMLAGILISPPMIDYFPIDNNSQS